MQETAAEQLTTTQAPIDGDARTVELRAAVAAAVAQRSREPLDELLDETLRGTFPASDPPPWWAGGS